MSVFIKGIEKPKNCYGCDFNMYDYELNCYCKINHGKTDKDDWTCDKPCPIVEIPAPHGRLIDADKLMHDISEYHVSDGKFQHWVDVQSPVIEAEGTDEGSN